MFDSNEVLNGLAASCRRSSVSGSFSEDYLTGLCPLFSRKANEILHNRWSLSSFCCFRKAVGNEHPS